MFDSRETAIAAATSLGLPPDELVPLGGASGQAYALSGRILRVGTSETIDVEVAAAARASAVVPVPQVVTRVDLGHASGLLVTRLPGAPAWQPGQYDPARARRRGIACGLAQLSLSSVTAPPQVPSLGIAGSETGGVDVLVHLDLHPLNILLGADDEVTAVLDWANASAGPVEYDRARTAAILYLAPSTQALQHDPSWRAFVAGWTATLHLDEVPALAIVWACRYMLSDLKGRYPAKRLRPVLNALSAAESAAVNPSKAPFTFWRP